jgi:hypothetical protein
LRLRLQDGRQIELSIRDVINICLNDAFEIMGIVEFCENRPANFEDMVNRVKLLASVADDQLTGREPELCMCVWNCRQAVQAQPMTLEEQQNLERSLCISPKAADNLEKGSCFEWQQRQARDELERSRPLSQPSRT